MRNSWVLLFALGASACAHVETVASSDGGYTLIVPTDVAESVAGVEQDASDRADELCPSGWVRLNKNSAPPIAAVVWNIHCVVPVARAP
jgi:hypothetical protein